MESFTCGNANLVDLERFLNFLYHPNDYVHNVRRPDEIFSTNCRK